MIVYFAARLLRKSRLGKQSCVVMNWKERRAAKKDKATSAPVGADAEVFARALQLHQAGRLGEAEALYRQVLAREPRHADATQLLGVMAHQLGRNEAALELINRAIALNAKAPQYHANLGQVLRVLGRWDEAAAAYRRAVALKPDYLDAQMGLAVVLQASGHSAEAAGAYRHVLALKPDLAEAHNNLGNALEDQGQLAEAAASYERAVVLRPSDAGMLYNFAAALLAGGDAAKALAAASRALTLGETPEIKALIGNCVKELRNAEADPAWRRLVTRALSEAWGRPQDLAAAAVMLVKQGRDFAADGLGAASGDHLLRALLENVVIGDLDLERWLTRLRADVLALAERSGAVDDKTLGFCCALARQCFINDYVHALPDDELQHATALRDRLTEALQAGQGPPALWIVAVAAYFPLHTVWQIKGLLVADLPEPLAALLTQQIREPAQERRLMEELRCLTPVNDAVSLQVQRQYEENPYPRWVKAGPAPHATTLDMFLAKRFPAAPLHPLGRDGAIEILVAGCGTGQHSLETARLFDGARMLAVDLSRASLAYAKRQGEALGVTGIDYAQADIIELGTLGRRFDLIEASGVLHHLADPLAGWRVLVSLLRPGGVMWLGLYSELAREDVVAGRRFIAERGFGDSAEEIRRARQEMIASGPNAPFAPLTRTADFFATSACRDLLFHVQEHRLSVTEIATFLSAHGLNFIGFDLDARTSARYRARFPADRAMTDLANWHQFETENKLTFRAMYQFWVQKPG